MTNQTVGPQPLPKYKLRESRKAKYLQLQVSEQGLEVVVPRGGASAFEIERLLLTKRDWITAALSKYTNTSLTLPSSLHFRAIAQVWQVTYDNKASKQACTRISDDTIRVTTNDNHQAIQIKILKRFIRQQANLHIPAICYQLSTQYGLPYNKLTIRYQKTRWGSCSAKKDLTLNAKLLFLPIELLKHVIAHELSHTQHLNHGSQFWQLLKKLDENALIHDRALNDTSEWIPALL